ncbi:hypothetical protein Q8A73_006613 [Channa argus]|nr:hypothetical protein Q8A73_006613 [Channa argus]
MRPDLGLELWLLMWFPLLQRVWGRWCLSVRARLLPLGALPFRRARPQEPPACQTDLCSQMQPQRSEEEKGGEGGGGGANVKRSPEREGLEGKRVEEDLRERVEERGLRRLHWNNLGLSKGEEGGEEGENEGGEGDTEVPTRVPDSQKILRSWVV